MERKTKVTAEEGQQYLWITREFELPVELLFKAHGDPELFAEWMSHDYGKVKVVEFESRKHGGWRFQNIDLQGNVVFEANGVFHDFDEGRKIVRTFEMANSPIDVQLEFLEFEKLGDDTSKLTMQIIYRSLDARNQMLKVPFAEGLNMAHNRLEKIVGRIR